MNLYDDKKQGEFVNGVVSVILDKNPDFHVPDSFCFKGTCPRCRAPKDVNWNALIQLTILFWKGAPNVSDSWKRAAVHEKFDPNKYHDIMLGVFVGADHAKPAFYSDENGWWRATGNFNKGTNPGVVVPGARLNP